MSRAPARSIARNAEAVDRAPQSAVTQQVRGAGLLFIGRLLGLALDFGSQALLIRYLVKTDFGALSYALAVVMFFQGLAMFEMSNTLSRFVPLYRERKQYARLFGGLRLAFGVVVGLGLLVAICIGLGLTILGLRPSGDPLVVRLLLLLVVLIPLQGLDGLFTSLFAAFGASRTIFMRQSVLAPGLKLCLTLLVILLGMDVQTLAVGYLIVGMTGLLLYSVMFVRLLRAQGLLQELSRTRLEYPVREMLGFATPLLTTTLVWTLMRSADTLLLGHFHGAVAVADFRAVLPAAQLSQMVILSFGMLFMPIAARLYAGNRHAELGELYWQSALWMTIVAFPIFVLTCSFAQTITVGIYGAAYAGSAPIMAILAIGYFTQTSLGFNGTTLKVYRKLRYTVTIDIMAAVLNLGLIMLLIPRWGAVGAAIGTAITMIVHNLLKQFGLWKHTGISLFNRAYLLVYGAMVVLSLALGGIQALLPVRLAGAIALSGGAWLIVLWLGRDVLRVDTMFPELRDWKITRVIPRRK